MVKKISRDVMNKFKPFSHQGVEVHPEKVVIPTYAMGPDDANPALLGKGLRSVYPYPWQKSFTTRVEEKSYDAIVVTSKWIRATLLPDWGMHLYRAIDRASGRDLFHCPGVIKPAHNALRGAYVAGGVEFNFPIGHTTATLSRVGLYIRRAPSGVQALFHNIDRRSGTECAVGLTLSNDFCGIVFDQHFHNPTPLPQPWYYWLNAGLAPHPSLRFMFPTRQMLGHFEGAFLERVERYDYPRHEGIDYSRYMDIPEPIGLFSPAHLTGWFGAWYDDWNFGVVRWAPPWRVAGQKFWSWGNSDEGRLWGRIMADQELPVPEIQSGRPETQLDRGILLPYAATSHQEWWMPVAKIGDVQGASKFGALALKTNGRTLRIGIWPAQSMGQCKIEINGRAVGRTAYLRVGRLCEVQLSAPPRIERVDVIAAAGTVLSWSAKPPASAANVDTLYDNPKPVKELGPGELVSRGFRHERMFRPDLARHFYELALAKETSSAAAHLRLGTLALHADRAEEAAREFAMALEADRWNNEALYLHGLACLWIGRREQALADFARTAATGDEYAAAAMVQLAQDAMRRQDYLQAEMMIADGLERDPENATLLSIRVIVHRRAKRAAMLETRCADLDRVLGLSLMARWERKLARRRDNWFHVPGDADLEDFRLVAAALRYAEAGAVADAIVLLRKASSKPGRARASYLIRWLSGRGAASRGAAAPFAAWGRPEKLAIQAAVTKNHHDAAAHFALGCLLAEERDLPAAVEHLAAAAKQTDDSITRTALGLVYLEMQQSSLAVKQLSRAVTLSPANPTAWVLLDQALCAAGRRDRKWLVRFTAAPAEVLDNEEAREALARLACDLDELDQTAALLEGTEFHPYELSHGLRNLWSRIHRRKALRQARDGNLEAARESIERALEYPSNLQLGRPLRRFDSMTLYTAGCIAAAAGDTTAAEDYFSQAAAEDPPGPTPAKPWSILAQARLGQKGQAQERLRRLVQETQCYLDAQFAPDLRQPLEEILSLAGRIQQGWLPNLDKLIDDTWRLS